MEKTNERNTGNLPLTTSSNLRINRHEPPRKSRFHEPRCQTDVAILKHRTRCGDSTGAPRHHSAAFDLRPAGQQAHPELPPAPCPLTSAPTPLARHPPSAAAYKCTFPQAASGRKTERSVPWRPTAGPLARQDTLIIPIIRLNRRPATIFFFPRRDPRPKSSSSSPNSRCADLFPGVANALPKMVDRRSPRQDDAPPSGFAIGRAGPCRVGHRARNCRRTKKLAGSVCRAFTKPAIVR